MPGNLGSRKHLILIKTEGSGSWGINHIEGRGEAALYSYGEQGELSIIAQWRCIQKVHTEKINYPFFHTLKPIESFELSLRPHSCNVFVNSWPGSHPFGKPEQELYFQLSNLSPIILFLHFSIVTLTGSTLCFTAQIGDIAEPGLTRGHVGKGRLSTSAGQWGVWHQASGAAYCCSLLLAHGGGEGSPSSRTVCVSLLWAVWQLECLAWGNGDSSDLLSSFCSYWKTLSPTLFALLTEIQLVDLPAPCVTVFAPPH